MINKPDHRFEEIITVKNRPIYLKTIAYILYSIGYSWSHIQYISGTKDLWYPVHARAPYIKITVDHVSKRFIYKEMCSNTSIKTMYNTLFKLL